MDAAFTITAIVLLRSALAWVFKEKNNGWKAYCAVLLLSPILIELSFGIASGFLPFELSHEFP